ncbi:MAG: hypothetical protein IJ302_04520, partial [Clostridia bacterium]|nr:hypothetical protein [Clostridia bacterium]
MAIYYIDPLLGSAENDGHSPETALYHPSYVKALPGDTVLFRRGCIFREMFPTWAGTEDAPITYGAYGEGDKPVFCGSLDASDPGDWEEIDTNIWQYCCPTMGDVGNIIFTKKSDDSRPWCDLAQHERNARLDGATLRWERADLCEQGDFWDSRFGESNHPKEVPTEQILLLYSVGNPANVYAHIELAHWGGRRLGWLKSDIVIEDIEFFGSGVHALAGDHADR